MWPLPYFISLAALNVMSCAPRLAGFHDLRIGVPPHDLFVFYVVRHERYLLRGKATAVAGSLNAPVDENRRLEMLLQSGTQWTSLQNRLV